jgi:hypothetical protein
MDPQRVPRTRRAQCSTSSHHCQAGMIVTLTARPPSVSATPGPPSWASVTVSITPTTACSAQASAYFRCPQWQRFVRAHCRCCYHGAGVPTYRRPFRAMTLTDDAFVFLLWPRPPAALRPGHHHAPVLDDDRRTRHKHSSARTAQLQRHRTDCGQRRRPHRCRPPRARRRWSTQRGPGRMAGPL